MTEIYNCLLWENAKELAKDRGLKMDAVCPVDSICKGTVCVFLAEAEPMTDEEKLQALRQEIGTLNNK